MRGQVISGNWPKVGDRRQVSGPTNGGWRCVAKWKGGGGYCWMMVEWRWARMLCVLFIETLGNGKSKVWQCEY